MSLHFPVTFDVKVFATLENINMVIRVFDSEPLNQRVLMLDGTTLFFDLLLSLFKLLWRGILLQSNIEKHFGEIMERSGGERKI